MKRFIPFLLCLSAGWLSAERLQAQDTIEVVLFADTISQVNVLTRRTPPANSRFSDILPVELATMGGANGDLYKALQTLPGTQIQGESGKLLVRGGSSEEVQTFIDGMHVLNPYTSGSPGSQARSRYSTFMFSGVNFASGGAPLEYGDALSAVLPLETKDYSTVDKTGLNASVVGVGGGGTRVLEHGSLSLDLNYQNLQLYEQLFPSRTEYQNPYTMASVAGQWRHSLSQHTLLKLYAQFDRTDVASWEGVESRLFDLGESNLYLNTTLQTRLGDWHCMSGAAFSLFRQDISGAEVVDDRWRKQESELHLKWRGERRLGNPLRLSVGMEGYLRHYDDRYRLEAIDSSKQVSPRLAAGFGTLTLYPAEWLKVEGSLRAEYATPGHEWHLTPRLSANLYAGYWMVSAVYGCYTQSPLRLWLATSPSLRMEECRQYNVGVQYKRGGRFFKAELYDKSYRHLALLEEGCWNSRGHGYSRGLDLYLHDAASIPYLEYQLSYTYNIGRRKQGTIPLLTTPQYATRHNASLVLKYNVPRLNSIIGVTNSFCSGRPWHNEALPGWMNDELKPYHTLDLGITYLPSRKVIIHASATNLLGRTNVFGREDGRSVLASSNHFFYVGIFLTLGKKAAYDVSNF